MLSVDDGIGPLLGFSAEDFLASRVSLKDRIHPDDADIAARLFSPQIEDDSGTFNIRLRHADGRIRCVRGEYSRGPSLRDKAAVLELLLQDAKSLWKSPATEPVPAHFKALMENTDDFIFFKDRNHLLTGASRSVMDVLDADGRGSTALGQADYDLFPEEYADVYYRLEKEVFAGAPVASEVNEYLKPAGSLAWMDNHKYPIRNDKGEIVGLFGIARDVTERVHGERALRAAEERYRTIFDGALEGIFRAVIGDRILIANPAAARILGYDSPEDFYDSIKDASRDIWVDPAERAVFLQKLREDEGHAVLRHECQFKRKDGTTIWVSLNSRLVYAEDGKEDYVEGFFTDVSERKVAETALKQNEEFLREAQRIAGLGNYILDIQAGTWTSSDVLDLLFGIDKDYKRSVEGWGALVHPDDREAMVAYFGDQVVGKGKPFDREYRVVRPSDGAVRWMHGMGRLEFDSQGRPVRMLGTIRDITEQRRAEESLRESKEILRLFIENAPAGLAMFDREMRYLATSRRWLEMHSLLGGGVIGRSHYEVFPEIPESWRAEHRSALAGQRVSAGEELLKRANGSVQWVKREIIPWRAGDGAIGGIVLFSEDVTQQRQTEQGLRLAASVFTNAREGIIITDPDGAILEVNEMFTRITGYTREEALGQNPRFLKSGLQNEEFYATMWRSLIKDGHWSGEIWNRTKSGDIIAEMLTINAVRDISGNLLQYVSLFSDITEIKKHAQQLEHLTHYDMLTNLPNRALLADRLNQAMALAKRRKQMVAVAYLDLDGFKDINDSHGHDAGDRLLTALASDMKRVLRAGDTLARLGGDEFVAVMVDLDNQEASVPVLALLLEAAAKQVQVGNLSLCVSASIGVTFYPQPDEVDADLLLRQADQAMYQAKLASGNRYHIFNPDHDQTVRGRHENLEHIRRALAERNFVLYYQPKVNMRTGKVVGAEALIRWKHPERGLLPPGLFLPVIEDHPLAIEIGEWVIESVLAQMECWNAAGIELPVSVNVSAIQLQRPDFVDRLSSLLAAHPSLKPFSLEIEVVETSALQDVAQTSQVLTACQSIGVSFALDDFGTGYSSLTYLKRLPASILKIDQSFVSDMLDDPENLNILEGILGLASAFHRQVIAEGVETVEHGSMLLRLGCELAQGYGIARPMLAGDLPGWLSAWRPDPHWAKVPKIHSGNRALLYACVEHGAWLAAFEAFLQGRRHSPPPLDQRQCRFGVWLDAETQAGRGQQSAYRLVDTVHRQFHKLASSIVAAQSGGRSAEGIEHMGELHRLGDDLLQQLETLMQWG